MKNALLILAVLIVGSVMGNAMLYCHMSQLKGELAKTNQELLNREKVWWELRSLVNTYHQGIIISIPDYPGGGVPSGPMVVDTKGGKGRYEFAPDGKSAKRIIKFADGRDRTVETWPIPTDLTVQ